MSNLESVRSQLAATEGEAEASAARAAGLQQQAKEAEGQVGDLNRQLAEALQRQAKATAAAEEQAVRADKWESQCIGAQAASVTI